MAEDLGEKTEEATPRRRQEAREEGQVARSQDVASALILLVATAVVAFAVLPGLERMRRLIEVVLDGATVSNPLRTEGVWPVVVFTGAAAASVLAPILLFTWVGALVAHVWQVGWMFSPKAVQPRLSKIDPRRGFARIFGLSGLVKAVMDFLKVLAVVAVSVVTIRSSVDRIVVLPQLTALQTIVEIGRLMLDLALRVLAVLLILGILDYAFQRWRHNRDLRMTKQQVKDELKHTEGDPEVKKRRMRMQQQIAMQRINAAVPRADVIVTNPEHVSVAIRYESDRMNAPKVVAKGADYLALRIRQIALAHRIPVLERPPLARALYRQVKVGQEIPPEFYQAVAEVLAYVYRASARMAG